MGFMNFDNRIQNNKILNIVLEKNIYRITVPLKNQFINNVDDYYFTLEERYTEQEILLSSILIDDIDDYKIFEIIVPIDDNFNTFIENDIWDLYITRKTYSDIRKKRVKSNYENIRFLSIVYPEISKMFYPYSTKKGNISFRLNDYFLYSQLEEVDLSNNTLNFSGYYNFPPLYKTSEYKILNVELIVKNNVDEDEIKLPLEKVAQTIINENDPLTEYGFKGEFPFTQYVNLEQKTHYRFYLEMSYLHQNETKTIRSGRLAVNPLNKLHFVKIISLKNTKVKIVAKPLKAKFFSLQISKHNFKNEVIKKVKSKWLRFRRSKKVKMIYKKAFTLLGYLPVKKNSIMFESFAGKQYSDNPRAIYEYMNEHYPHYKMYWSVNRRNLSVFTDKNVNYIRRFSVKWLWNMSRAQYWVSNSRLPLWLPKPNHTTYLQTWHGTPLKRLAADMDQVLMPGTNTRKYKRNFIYEASKWDYLISPNAYSTEIFERAFQFDRTMIESGYPRNDFLINENNTETINRLKRAVNLPLDKKIILYAPTWRDNQFYKKGKYKFNLQMDLDLLKQKLGEEYIILLRLHYLIAENIDLTGYEGFVYDFSYHEDIRELYLIADMLITDYSSVFFDYANLKRPMIFYVYDIEEYRDNLRGFYFDFEATAPGPLVKTTEEIICYINDINSNGFHPTIEFQNFYNKFCYLEDGNATKRVVEKVFTK